MGIINTFFWRKHEVRFWQSVPAIEKKPEYVLFRLGLPYPVESTAETYAEGAGRKCIFSDGIVFDEKIVVYEPNRNLVFDITKQSQHPESLGHIDIQRGQFLLHDNGDGTTTLEGTSCYRLYVKPAAYFNTWAESIIRNVHLRVMEHIKELSERRES